MFIYSNHVGTPFLPGQDDRYRLPRAGHGRCDELLAKARRDSIDEPECANFGRPAVL